jgi:hypothetical protein
MLDIDDMRPSLRATQYAELTLVKMSARPSPLHRT